MWLLVLTVTCVLADFSSSTCPNCEASLNLNVCRYKNGGRGHMSVALLGTICCGQNAFMPLQFNFIRQTNPPPWPPLMCSHAHQQQLSTVSGIAGGCWTLTLQHNGDLAAIFFPDETLATMACRSGIRCPLQCRCSRLKCKEERHQAASTPFIGSIFFFLSSPDRGQGAS